MQITRATSPQSSEPGTETFAGVGSVRRRGARLACHKLSGSSAYPRYSRRDQIVELDPPSQPAPSMLLFLSSDAPNGQHGTVRLGDHAPRHRPTNGPRQATA